MQKGLSILKWENNKILGYSYIAVLADDYYITFYNFFHVKHRNTSPKQRLNTGYDRLCWSDLWGHWDAEASWFLGSRNTCAGQWP